MSQIYSQIYSQFISKNNEKLIIFIHGFLGSSDCYNFLIKDISYDILLVDIPGHGKSSISQKDSFQQIARKIFKIIQTYSHSTKILVGYSMGGRFCLQICSFSPDYFKGLILESAGFGISNFFKRVIRYRWQQKIIKKILQKKNISANGKKILRFWYNQYLFSSLQEKKSIFQKIIFQKKQKISLPKIVLAFNLFSPLNHYSFYPTLSKLVKQKIKIFYLAGEKDKKYKNVLFKLKKYYKIHGCIFKNIGHNIKLEAPTLYKEKIKNLLEEIK